ncbi:uncharacterized protein LOC34620839 [Cyclospora cayetanensis]|uniref:Uncharacterized protein LOC34620839 n=1 Tax=Cyclospora cayetanensis TaxID=88456 RepID=A0A6P6S400_9EIME|nr:uncharacterized protein LOC34620839 [Cyclospora cayetanensis]
MHPSAGEAAGIPSPRRPQSRASTGVSEGLRSRESSSPASTANGKQLPASPTGDAREDEALPSMAHSAEGASPTRGGAPCSFQSVQRANAPLADSLHGPFQGVPTVCWPLTTAEARNAPCAAFSTSCLRGNSRGGLNSRGAPRRTPVVLPSAVFPSGMADREVYTYLPDVEFCSSADEGEGNFPRVQNGSFVGGSRRSSPAGREVEFAHELYMADNEGGGRQRGSDSVEAALLPLDGIRGASRNILLHIFSGKAFPGDFFEYGGGLRKAALRDSHLVRRADVLRFPKKNFALMGCLDGLCGIMAVVGGVHTSEVVPLAELWTRLINGGKCLFGISIIVPPECGPVWGVPCDFCEGAWVEVLVYVLFNLIYNVCSMLVLKHCGATVLFLIMTVRLPLTSMAFYSKLIVGDSAVPAKATDFFGLLILLVGLLAFRLGGQKSSYFSDEEMLTPRNRRKRGP